MVPFAGDKNGPGAKACLYPGPKSASIAKKLVAEKLWRRAATSAASETRALGPGSPSGKKGGNKAGRDRRVMPTAYTVRSHTHGERTQEGQPEDLELRKGWPWWKLKKWVLHVINRMFSRFGNSKVVKGDHQKAFAVMFSKEWAGRFLQSFLQVRESRG